jgi:hypothetical protein
MTFNLHKSQLRTLRQGDPKFMIQDGFVRAPRAGFHILPECPQNYKQIIATCIDNGWLKPVAHVTERELLFMGLSTE